MKRLLVVEDDAAIREMMRRRLAMRGFDVWVAVKGAETVAAALELHPDALLLDIELPGGMNGRELADAARQVRAARAARLEPGENRTVLRMGNFFGGGHHGRAG